MSEAKKMFIGTQLACAKDLIRTIESSNHAVHSIPICICGPAFFFITLHGGIGGKFACHTWGLAFICITVAPIAEAAQPALPYLPMQLTTAAWRGDGESPHLSNMWFAV